jgi:hypothetical protein
MFRQIEVLLLLEEKGFERGVQAQIARELGVHRSTITRDMRRIFWPNSQACPTCERDWSVKMWKQLYEDRQRRNREDPNRDFLLGALQDAEYREEVVWPLLRSRQQRPTRTNVRTLEALSRTISFHNVDSGWHRYVSENQVFDSDPVVPENPFAT